MQSKDTSNEETPLHRLLGLTDQSSRMHDRHHRNNNQHESTIEDIHHALMIDQEPIITLFELDDPYKITDEEERADKVQRPHIPSPRESWVTREGRMIAAEAYMYACRERDVDEENDDLRDETGHDECRTSAHRRNIGAHSRTCDLTGEASNVEQHKEFRHPAQADRC